MLGHDKGHVLQATAAIHIFTKITSSALEPNMCIPPLQVLAVPKGNCLAWLVIHHMILRSSVLMFMDITPGTCYGCGMGSLQKLGNFIL